MRRFALALFTTIALSAAACGPSVNSGNGDGGPGGDGSPPPGGLRVTPPMATVMVTGAGPATQAFTAEETSSGRDVTAMASWTLGDAQLGSISAGVFTSATPLPHGGVTTVQASQNGKLGSAMLTVIYAVDVVDPSAPPGAQGGFGGAVSMNPADSPAVVYPFDGTMLARNINQMNIQWTGKAGYTMYKIHLEGGAVNMSFYLGASLCAGGTQCSFRPSDAAWQAIARSASTGGPVTMTVEGTAGAGMPVGRSPAQSLLFSPEDVKGGLYYFSTSIRGIKRLPFGASQATDFIVDGNEYGCAGCHAVSRDGSKVAVEFGGGDGYAGMVDGANGQSYLIQPDTGQTNPWNFASFSPDGAQMVTNWAGRLQLRDGNTGQLIMSIPQSMYGAKEAVMPEWSPDGQSIAFVGIPAEGYIGKDMSTFFPLPAGDWILGNGGSIMVMPYNGGAFGPAREVVPSIPMGEYNFYPTWSPDSQWIAFATGTWPGSSPTAAANGVDTTGKCMSYDQDTARLRMVAAAGGVPIELTQATHAENRTVTWPKFAPFVQGGGKLVFLTFSTKFAYGFVVPDQARPQIWMAGIDLGQAASGGDPSFPPFWLPFQDPSQNNHETIWTTDVACITPEDCPDEFACEGGTCVPIIP